MPRKKSTSNCSIKSIAKKAYEVSKKSNAKNPAKTGNLIADYAIGKIPFAKEWNKGFNVGKLGFIAHQTYKETCKRKK